MDIKELATLTAAEMDDVYRRNVPAIVLEHYCTRFLAAYIEGQEPVARVVDGGGELHLPKLQWVSADHSLETPIGSPLFTAPPLPAIPAERIATLEQQRDELLAALEPFADIQHYSLAPNGAGFAMRSNGEAVTYGQIRAAKAAIAKVKP